jgi:uncharacterized membrane protein YedE/YeeE
MIDSIQQPWPWYVAGPLIGLTVPLLLFMGNKSFGLSSSLRHICASCIPAKIPFFQYNWKQEVWNLYFVGGILIGSFLAAQILSNPEAVHISEETVADLEALGVEDFSMLLPADIFSWESLLTIRGFVFIVIGGFLVGFGTRYGGGCTSGHAIMGLSNLQWPSLVATICFMLGGFLTTWFVLPFLLDL